MNLDAVDLALLDAMNKHPRAGALELSRQVKVARATVQARLKRMEDAGVIAGYAPHINLAAGGFGVQAFVTLQIAQGALDTVTAELEAIPGVLEAFATTGSGDVLCRIAAASHEDLPSDAARTESVGDSHPVDQRHGSLGCGAAPVDAPSTDSAVGADDQGPGVPTRRSVSLTDPEPRIPERSRIPT